MTQKPKSLENRNWDLKRESKERQKEYYRSHPEKLWEDIFSMIQRNAPPKYPKSYRGKERVKVVWRIDVDKRTLESIHLDSESGEVEGEKRDKDI